MRSARPFAAHAAMAGVDMRSGRREIYADRAAQAGSGKGVCIFWGNLRHILSHSIFLFFVIILPDKCYIFCHLAPLCN